MNAAKNTTSKKHSTRAGYRTAAGIFIELDQYFYAKDIYHGPGWYNAFQIMNCDRCGDECKSPNSLLVKVGELPKAMFSALAMRDSAPGEIGYCDTFDGAVCHDCFGKGKR